MTELEKITHAKVYMEKLAQGINPIDDQPIKENDVANNISLSRCFFYVSDILRQVIENKGIGKAKKIVKQPFEISKEVIKDFSFSNSPISVSNIVDNINSLIDTENMKKITIKNITDWLIKVGLLEIKTTDNGRNRKLPTPIGEEFGITTLSRFGKYGPYTYTAYDISAQKFIIDNIGEIIEMIKN